MTQKTYRILWSTGGTETIVAASELEARLASKLGESEGAVLLTVSCTVTA